LGENEGEIIKKNNNRSKYNMNKINRVHSFWTHDGSILVKERENSKVKVIKNQSDADKME
jgi:hypothetical protein